MPETEVTSLHGDASAGRGLAALGGVPVRISVEVGSVSMRLADLLALEEGSVVELDRQAGDPLDVLANGTLLARGEIVAVDGRYGIRIVDVVTAESAVNGFERRRP